MKELCARLNACGREMKKSLGDPSREPNYMAAATLAVMIQREIVRRVMHEHGYERN